MRKIVGFILAAFLFAAGARAQTVTPNIGLQVPLYNQANWQVPINYDLNRLDLLLSGGLPLPTLNPTQFKLVPVTFSQLPTCTSSLNGALQSVSDSTTQVWGATISGGGSSYPVVWAYCNGTNWVVSPYGGGGIPSGLTNPMTTLGDFLVGGLSGAATRLAGNTTNTPKYLMSLGSGGVASAPVLQALPLFNGPVCDLTQPICLGISIPSGSDITTKANACLGIQSGMVCDGRAVTSPVGSVAISTSKTGGTLIMPSGTYTLPYGFNAWSFGRLEGGGLPSNTVIYVSNGDGVYGSASGFEVDHLQVYASSSSHYGYNLICFACKIHDVLFQGQAGGLLGPGGGGYFSDSTNIGANCLAVGCHAFELTGNTNANYFGTVNADVQNGATQSGINFVFSGNAYNNTIARCTVEQNGLSQFALFETGAHVNGCLSEDFENDSPLPVNSNAWLTTFATGVTGNFMGPGFKMDCVDNSGNQTNSCVTTASPGYAIRSFYPGRFAVTRIANSSGPSVTALNSYYGNPPAVILPTGTYFGGGSYTTEIWAYIPLAVVPWDISNGPTEVIAQIGNAPNDNVTLYYNAQTGFPELQVYEGAAPPEIVVGANPLTLNAWNHIVVQYTSGSPGTAVFYINGSCSSPNSDCAGHSIWNANSVTRSTNALGTSSNLDPHNGTQFHAYLAEFAIYPSALSSTVIGNHYSCGFSGTSCTTDYPTTVAASSPTVYYRLNDAPTSLPLTAAAAASGGSTVYTGTMPGGCSTSTYLANITFYVSGFSNTANNSASGAGPFVATSCTLTTLTLKNPSGVLEPVATAAAVYPNVATATVGSNGTYTGAVTLNVQSGIPYYGTGSGKSAQLGGATLWTYYQWLYDKSASSLGVTNVSPASYGVNFTTLDTSNYNLVSATGVVPGVYQASVARGSTTGCIANQWLIAQFPLYDNGSLSPGACSPATPTADTTGNGIFPGNVNATWVIANQGSGCTNGELALSGGWGSTAAVSAAHGQGQSCSWTITSNGSGAGANPTITDTFTNPLPSSATDCRMGMEGGTGTLTMIDSTTPSATAWIFTFLGTPAGSGATYHVWRACGP